MVMSPKPWWLSWFTKPHQWITVHGTIYHPQGVTPEYFPAIIAHELVHVEQQRGNFIRFLLRYVLSKRWRLEYEAAAIAVELSATDPSQMDSTLEWYCMALSGSVYRRAARTPVLAHQAILRAMAKSKEESLPSPEGVPP